MSGTTKNIKRIASVVIACLGLTIGAQAKAASVAYFLDQSNDLPDGVNYLQVTIDDEGTAGFINFSVQTLAPLNNIAASNYGIGKFGFNTNNITITSGNITGLPTGWSFNGSGNLDGFGAFDVREQATGQYRVSVLAFSVKDIIGDTVYDYVALSSGNAGSGNVYFAAHVGGFTAQSSCGGCTSAYFGGTTSVPLPATVWLFGSGLIPLVVIGRRKTPARKLYQTTKA